MKIVLGILLGFGLGAFCRWLDIPLPSPPKVVGAVMVIALTLGFVAADWGLDRGQPATPEKMQAAPNEVGLARSGH